MPFKPMPTRKFLKLLKRVGWTMVKGAYDWNLYDENEIFVCSVIRQHPGEDVIVALSVAKVTKKLKERGLPWQ